MRIAFMGTPEFAARILIEIKEQHDIVCVHTRPDAVRGRGSKLVSSPVKRVALESGIPVREPRTLRDAGELAFLRSLAPDVVCVAAYGKILPQAVLDVPRFGCLNVHASLLPKYRGAAPIERAILAGDEQVGVCIMRMETGLDTGPFCISRSVAVAGRGCEHLTGELADIGSCALLSALAELETGAVRWIDQDDACASYAPKIERGELDLDPAESVAVNLRRVQASSTAHTSRCRIGAKGITVVSAGVAPEGARAPAQGMATFSGKKLLLGCADGAVELHEVRPDGKATMSAKAFAAGVQGLKNSDIDWEKR